jgi:hypothetical protein
MDNQPRLDSLPEHTDGLFGRENKNRENEELLLNVLPAPIANRLRSGEEGIRC